MIDKQANKFFNTEALVEVGNKMLQLVAKKYQEVENLEHPIVPNILPGFIRSQLPSAPPQKGEDLEAILKDTSDIIFTGSTLWCHPNFFAYFPVNTSHSIVIAEIFASAFGTPGFQWNVNPVQTELENVVCDWIVQALNLPEIFLIKNQGGGTISQTVSDSVFLSVHVAKRKKMKELGIDERNPEILKMVGYYSSNTHTCMEKALYLKDVPYMRIVPSIMNQEIGNFQVDLEALKEMIDKDIKEGLIPFWYGSIFGSTLTGAYDQIDQLGDLAKSYGIWLNVDAAYGGLSWVIPEYRVKALGLEKVDSFQVNFSKLMMSGLAGGFNFVADKQTYTQYLKEQREQSELSINSFSEGYDVVEYKDWDVSQERHFNSLKMWWLIRSLGIEGMQEHIQIRVDLSRYFESLINESQRWRVFTKGHISVTTFLLHHRDLEQQNVMNRRLHTQINQYTDKGFISGSIENGTFFMRFVVSSNLTTKSHIDKFWLHINEQADTLISKSEK